MNMSCCACAEVMTSCQAKIDTITAFRSYFQTSADALLPLLAPRHTASLQHSLLQLSIRLLELSDGLFEILALFVRLLFSNSVSLLKPSHKLLILACDCGKLVVHHRAPMMDGFPPPLLPLSLHSIPVHWPPSFHARSFIWLVRIRFPMGEPFVLNLMKYTGQNVKMNRLKG
jgi:hypothetical protein